MYQFTFLVFLLVGHVLGIPDCPEGQKFCASTMACHDCCADNDCETGSECG